MNQAHYQFGFNELKITSEEVLDLMRYSRDIPGQIREVVFNELENLQDLTDIEGGYILYPVSLNGSDASISIDGNHLSLGKVVFDMLKQAESAAAFLCTAGKTISLRSRQLMENGDILEGYVVDVIGSLTVEKAMDVIHHKYLKKECDGKGVRFSNRYSPGYCEWHVSDQQVLFRLFPEDFCHVSLTPSSLMQPIKSISGIIGIGPSIRFSKYTCSKCDIKDCIYRGKMQSGKYAHI